MRVLIVGGGVIGTSLAYCLALRGAKVTLIERSGIACAASGKAGGFLALDWCEGSLLNKLARRSFALHAAIAGVAPRILRLAAERGEIDATHPLAEGPWIFSRVDLDSSVVRSLAQRAKLYQKHPTVPDPDQQTLFTSIT